jgi:histone H3/H4
MTLYKSDRCINEIQKELGLKLSADKRAMVQKILRSYFVDIHKQAVEKTIMAKNKNEFVYPNFHD